MKYYRANRDVLFRYIADECFDTVHVKKTETHTFFGARFPDENAQVIVYKEGGCLR